jgi:ATP-binding cassette subfamily B protein
MLWALLRQYVRPYRWLLTVVAVLQVISTLASLYLPTINARIIDDGVAKGDTDAITGLGGMMLGVTALQALCAVGAVYYGSRAGMGFGRDLRSSIFHHVTGLSAEETARFGAPTLLTRTTNDVQQIQLLVAMTCTMLITAPIMSVGGTPAAAVPHHATPHRRHQSRAARTVDGHPGDPCVRARTARTGALRASQPGAV